MADGPAARRALKIGEAAGRLGLSTQALRFYESEGLLEPRRSARGTRLYDAADMTRLALIQLLTRLGVPLSLVRELVAARAASPSGGQASRRVDGLLETVERRVDAQRQACEELLAEIVRARNAVKACFDCDLAPRPEVCAGCAKAPEVTAARLIGRLVWERPPQQHPAAEAG